MTVPRSRLMCAVTLVAVVAAGLASRVFGRSLPGLVATYAGDTLYATMIFVGLATTLMPRASTSRLAASALAWSVAVEISQLYRAPWLDAIRRTLPGALVSDTDFCGAISPATWSASRLARRSTSASCGASASLDRAPEPLWGSGAETAGIH